MRRDEVNRTQPPPARRSAHCGALHAGGAVDCGGQDGPLRERVTDLSAAAASAQAASAVAELVAWTDSRWASVPEPWAVPTQGLCPCRRLLLGLVLFGRLRYQVPAARTGLSAQMVSVLCLTALRQMYETTTRETKAQSAAATSVFHDRRRRGPGPDVGTEAP